jgi:hypothetical protein
MLVAFTLTGKVKLISDAEETTKANSRLQLIVQLHACNHGRAAGDSVHIATFLLAPFSIYHKSKR